MVDALVRLMPAGSSIDVITTAPNRYQSFLAESPQIETRDGLSILRIDLPNHESGMLDQSRAFLIFARAALRETARQDYDMVFATSSRLMTAALAAWIAWRKQARLYLDIRDIFVDTIKDVLPRSLAMTVRPLFSALERFAIHKADKVNLVSAGFAEYFRMRYPKQRFSYFTNGIDDEFLAAAPVQDDALGKGSEANPRTVLYAGNLGEGQGLHAIIPALAARMNGRVRFVIIGDGGRRRALEAGLLKAGVSNVKLLPPITREDLLRSYKDADVLFLHLNDHDAFKKVLPSKVFEYAALGKPIWAGVSGYAAQFINLEIENAAVFAPCDVEGAARSFENLRIQDAPRKAFTAKYARARISQLLAADIVAVAKGSH